MSRTRIVIDTDPGVDDAVAILLALASPEVDVCAVTTVNGNVNVDKTTLNARRLMDLAGRSNTVIARGAAVPLASPSGDASEVHGADGLGDLTWPEPTTTVDVRDAVDVIWQLLAEGPLTIVAIGPLTNLALLLRRYPDAASKVERVVIMGGASFEGNVTPAAEFNIWADPEAAAEVCAATWPLTFMPLDLTHQALLAPEDLLTMRSWGTEVGLRLADMLEPYADFHETWYGNRDVIMHDAMAVYDVIRPGAISKQGVRVEVETGGRFSRGATWFDRRREHADSNQEVGVRVDNRAFVPFLLERLRTL